MKTALLKQVCTITMGQAPPGSSYNNAGKGLPLIAGASDFGEITPEPNRYTNTASKVSSSGDIILCIRATIGDRNWSNREYCLGRGVAGLRADSNKLDSRYLWHWLSTVQDTLTKQARGSTFKQVDKQAIENLEISLPPLEEQHRIAAILDKADAIRRKRAEAIRLTEELLRAVFLDMFGDPVTNPKGWQVRSLDATFARKPQIGTIKPSHTDGEQLVIRVGEIGGQNVDLDGCAKITLEGNDLEKFLCKPGDLLLARAIGSESHLGKASILQDTTQVVVFDSHVMRLRFLPERLLPMFFLQWLKTPGGRTRFMKEAGRTAVQFNVNAQQISRIEIPLPPIALQEQFMSFYIRTFKCLKNYESGEQAINNLFNSLLHRAFRGEL